MQTECRKDKPHQISLILLVRICAEFAKRTALIHLPHPSPQRAPMVANRHTVLVLLKHNIRSGSATHMQKLSTTDDVVQKSRLSLPQEYFISIITVTVVFPSNERASLQSTLHGPRTCQDSVFAHYYGPLQCSLPNLGCYLYLRTGLVHITDNIGSTLKIVVQTHEPSTN